MAISMNGRTFTTTQDKLYVNGKLVKAAYVNGSLVYPDGGYWLRLSGSGSFDVTCEIWWPDSGKTIYRRTFNSSNPLGTLYLDGEVTISSNVPLVKGVSSSGWRRSDNKAPSVADGDNIEFSGSSRFELGDIDIGTDRIQASIDWSPVFAALNCSGSYDLQGTIDLLDVLYTQPQNVPRGIALSYDYNSSPPHLSYAFPFTSFGINKTSTFATSSQNYIRPAIEDITTTGSWSSASAGASGDVQVKFNSMSVALSLATIEDASPLQQEYMNM